MSLYHCRVVILAADVSPLDVFSHLPVLCEDNQIPYVYVPSREALGEASQTKRPTSCVLVSTPKSSSELSSSFKDLATEIKEITPSYE